MSRKGLDQIKKKKIVSLRKLGFSIPEISSATGVAMTTVQRHVKEVKIPREFISRLREKQGSSKSRALARKQNSLLLAAKSLSRLSKRDHFLLLLGLYWGEGAKRDLSMINSDPSMISTFLACLSHMGISKDRITVSLRVHEDVNLTQAKHFWSLITRVDANSINSIERITGNKKGKLEHGMCRIRVRSGIRERLLIQSSIELIGKQLLKV